MLVIKKVFKEDFVVVFFVVFILLGFYYVNGNKLLFVVLSVYKNLVFKFVLFFFKFNVWKVNRMEYKLGFFFFSWEFVFISLIFVIKLVVLVSGVVLSFFKESFFSIIFLIEISFFCLIKLICWIIDRKSEFLKILKDDWNGDFLENRDCDKLEDLEDNSIFELKENGEEGCY